MKYYLTIAGRKYDFQRMKFKREATVNTQTAEILVLPAGGARPALGETVIINKEIDNTILLKWQGTIQQIQDVPLPNGVIKLIAYDLNFKLNFLDVKLIGYNASKGSTIFTSEIEPAITGLTSGTIDTATVGTRNTVIDTIAFGKALAADQSLIKRTIAFEQIQILSNADIFISRAGVADFGVAGVDRSSTHIMEHGINGTLMPDIGYSEDEKKRVTGIVIKGVGSGSVFKHGTAGAPSPTDKVNQIDLPYIQTVETANKVAATILTELNKTNKYAKFMLAPDVFKTNYDVYDTVKLKARLSTKNIDENLKIFSIETTVSAQDELHEVVIIELQNFERAVLAKMLNPIEASTNSISNMRTGMAVTQASNNIIPFSLAQHSSVFIEATVTSTPTNIGTIGTFSSQKTNGAYVHFGLKCVLRKDGGVGTVKVVRFYINLGAVKYPIDENIDHLVGFAVGDTLDVQITYFIPADVADATVTLIAECNGSVDVEGSAYMYSLGL